MLSSPTTATTSRIRSTSSIPSSSAGLLFAGNRITQQIHGNLDALAQPTKLVDGKNVTERFFGLAGCRSRQLTAATKTAFLGRVPRLRQPPGRGSRRTWAIVQSYNENACGALSCEVKLAPGESRTVAFRLRPA